jgi:hypothetical protein
MRKFLILAGAAAFATASSLALAAGPNDGPKYPNAESHKQYKDVRNLDHNNAAPRYPNMESHKQYKDVRIQDHNNGAPRYAATSTASTPPRASASRGTRYTVHASHRVAPRRFHG